MREREAEMRTFMFVALLAGLLVTAWLVLRDLREQSPGGSGTAAVAPIGRASEARRTLEAADRVKEQRAESASRE